MKNNTSQEIVLERINPKIWHWGYLALKPILNNIRIFSKVIEKDGVKRILDLGCGLKPYESLFPFAEKFIGLDIKRNEKVDIVGVNWNLPFGDNEFDALISTQVLEHTSKIKETVDEIRRVVKKDGLIFISVPLVFPEHGAPYDFYRFTKYGLREVFKEFEIIEIIPSGGYINTILRLWNAFLTSVPGSKYIFFPIFLANNLLAVLSDKMVMLIIKKIKSNSLVISIGNVYFSMPENYCLIARNKK